MIENVKIIDSELCFSQFIDTPEALTVKIIVSDFEPNGNDVMLNRKTIESWMDTLKSNPLLGKIGVSDNGKSDFEEHNYYEVTRVGADGIAYIDGRFDTSAMGVFVDVEIQTINNKEYITATAKVWKRFPEFCAVLKRRMTEGLLKSSWEIKVKKFHIETINGKKVKIIDDAIFIGHTLLGKHVLPAYTDARVLEVAALEGVTELINAIEKDTKEDDDLDNNLENTQETTSTTEISALTEYDLHKKLNDAIKDKLNVERYNFYIIHYFPEEKEVWVQKYNAASDLDILTFTYEVKEDVVTVSEPTAGKLSVSIAQINTVFSDMQEKINTSSEAIIVCNDTIKQLELQLTELKPYKDKFEKAEQERIAAELDVRRKDLMNYALESTYISKQEIETSEEIKALIEKVDEAGIKNIIADRVVASIKPKNKNTETSAAKAVITKDDDTSKYKSFIKEYIGGM